MVKAYVYPKCSTCKNAMKKLGQLNTTFEEINIYEHPPTKEELYDIWQKSGLPLRRLFNTSGIKYRELKLKDRLPHMSEDEMLELLASDGRLIKRPLLTDGTKVTIGYDPEKYEMEWDNSNE